MQTKTIWVNVQAVEVSDEVYAICTQSDRQLRYHEQELKTERFLVRDGQPVKVIPSREDSLERCMEENSEQFADESVCVEDEVLRKISADELHTAIGQLSEKEQRLIHALYFVGLTEQALANRQGVSQAAIHKQKKRILQKLKIFLEN